ncbi:aminotransferase class III-fold pyridoxal phosphate-dependent enzyme [Roseomonas terrae]|jgi:glutamate-1-semialdehyde 2,1-aminomutase|uniref:Aminotransferase class III-fold pyridoxal phosphate-dependent enzyme n=1 Tax=Neoroseomonas terrae TaxID=424799 RepID=A0ABS5EBI7_9PROT|nr:aminotransferase class III-fold pyridoxal phosphate-dependent enzyme [Neoroseomonas terrae]MBR0648374.1 aminotransferase class III-fold pyridoxal phosphate-dependent enzyme [Neoroseomonas terrae]
MSAARDLKRNSLDLPGAVEAARTAYAAKRPRSAALHEQALEVLAGGNTRTVIAYGPFPTAMTRGEDCRLWDLDDHAYLDLCGEYTAGLFGHSEPRIHAVLHDVLRRGINFASVGPGEEKLARIVCARFPSIDRVRFTNSGTEGNLMALTAARAFTGRDKIMAFRGGYHGGVLTFPAAGSSPSTLPLPFVLADYNDNDSAIAVARAHAKDLAAIIVEPMQGSGGCLPARPDFLATLRDLANETGAVLIFDEVMTSRHSGGGMQARLGITPDMTTLGKYIAGGMSFGAFGGRADIMAQFGGKLSHAGTFNNNVLSMSAGGVAMGEIFTAEVAEAHFQRGEALRARLDDIGAAKGLPLCFTGLGSMMTVQFRTPAPDRPFVPTAREEQLRELFFFDMLEAGIYLARRGMVALSLPVGDADLDRFVAAVAAFADNRAELLRVDGDAA